VLHFRNSITYLSTLAEHKYRISRTNFTEELAPRLLCLTFPFDVSGKTRYWTNKVRLTSRCNFSLLVLGGTTVHVCSTHMYYWTEYYQFCMEAVPSSGGNSAFVSVSPMQTPSVQGRRTLNCLETLRCSVPHQAFSA
jgi:hypothetical protein